MLNAIDKSQMDLRKSNFILNMYGVNQEKTINILKKKILENNISDLVKINDAVYKGRKEKVLLNTDVFILTSRFEGMPMGVIEALAYGVPCLVTKGTNMTGDIEEYNAGWTCDISDEKIEKAIKKMLNEKKKFSILGKNARNLAQKYSWREIAEKTHHEFEKIVEQENNYEFIKDPLI